MNEQFDAKTMFLKINGHGEENNGVVDIFLRGYISAIFQQPAGKNSATARHPFAV